MPENDRDLVLGSHRFPEREQATSTNGPVIYRKVVMFHCISGRYAKSDSSPKASIINPTGSTKLKPSPSCLPPQNHTIFPTLILTILIKRELSLLQSKHQRRPPTNSTSLTSHMEIRISLLPTRPHNSHHTHTPPDRLPQDPHRWYTCVVYTNCRSGGSNRSADRRVSQVLEGLLV